MTFYPTRLSHSHRRQLEEESAISPDVTRERGYYTARSRSEVPEAFADYQRRLGLVVPMYSPDGITRGWQLKSNKPRKKGPKYETPAGVSPVVDVHPRMLEEARHGDGPLLITEGAKTGDAATSRGMCTVVLPGVWLWCVPKARPYRLKPCFDHIRLKGREVLVAFDSDCMTKAGVQEALAALVAALEDRGAVVKVIYLPDAADGSKQGVDDYLAAGGTIWELRALARKFDPSDLGRIRLTRDEKLRAGMHWLRRAWRERDWMRFVGNSERGNWQRGHTARDVMEALISLAAKSGSVGNGGLEVRVGLRRLSEHAAKSAPSVGHAIKHLEADGQLEILPPEDRSKARSYRLLVPRAALYSMEGEGAGQGESNVGVTNISPTCKGLRPPTAPRLRWASPARPTRLLRHLEGATGRTVAEAVGENIFTPPDYRPYSGRLGPHRGAVIDALEHAGGELLLNELCEVLHRDRPRDVKRRILPRLEEAGVIECEGDVIRLSAKWLAHLDERREVDGEIEQAEKQAKKHKRQRNSYRLHLERERRGTPNASLAAVKRTEELRERRLREMREESGRDQAPTPSEVERLVLRVMGQTPRVRLGLLCEIALEEGLRWRDIPPAVRRMGYRVERLPEHNNAEFVLGCEHAPARPPAPPPPPESEPPPDDHRDHPLDCECDSCLYFPPSYARPYRGSGRRSA